MRRPTILLALIVAVSPTIFAPAKPASARGLLRWAYYVPDDPHSYQSLKAGHADLDIVAPDAWRIRPDGSIMSRIRPATIAQMRAWGLRVVPMVQKWSWYDKMHSFWASPAARRRAADELSRLVAGGRYDGINLDLENVDRRDSAALDEFISDIAARMHAGGYLATIALPARTTGRSGGAGNSYARYGHEMDLVVVMAYDYGWSLGRPAPVAPLPWVSSVAAYAATQIPRGKILLGIPWYGYDWNRSTGAMANYVAFRDAAARPGVRSYDSAVQAPLLRYSSRGQQHEVWYENAQSVGAKLGVVTSQELGGWAAWRLGYEDPALWRSPSPHR